MSVSLKVNWNDYYCLNAIKDCTIIHNIRLNSPKGGYNEYGCIIDKFNSPRGEIYTIGFPYPSYLLGDESRNIWEEILYRFPYSWNITKIPADQFGEDCEWQIDGNINNIIEEINKISDQFISLLKEKIENNELKGTKSDLLQTIDFAEYNYEKAKKNIKLESIKDNSMFKEDELDSKQDTKALDDLFSKSTDEIVDGLVNAADGDHELALRNLEQYMNTHDGFNRNILSARQKLQNKVESMKNSKFNKMIGEALSKFNEDSDRENQVYEVASSFANKYTCAEMADRLADVYREIDQANEYAQQKINELNISEEEFDKALDKYCDYCVSIGTACIYDTKKLNFNN